MFSLAEILKVSAATGILKRPKRTLQTLFDQWTSGADRSAQRAEFHPTSAEMAHVSASSTGLPPVSGRLETNEQDPDCRRGTHRGQGKQPGPLPLAQIAQATRQLRGTRGSKWRTQV